MSFIELKNYREHPSDSSYMVFHYADYEMACAFEDELSKAGIEFEKGVDDGKHARYLYAVKKRHLSAAEKLNHLALGLHRKPFMPDPVLRYFVIGLTIGLITLAFIGYLRS